MSTYTAHFTGGPQDGNTWQIAGAPNVYEFLAPRASLMGLFDQFDIPETIRYDLVRVDHTRVIAWYTFHAT